MSIAVAEHEITVHDLSSDRYITLSRACRQLPKKLAPSTLWRWRVDGVKIKGGRRVKLRCVRVGGRWFTTESWFSEFLRQQTEAALAPDTSVSAERPQETERRLAAAGLIQPIKNAEQTK